MSAFGRKPGQMGARPAFGNAPRPGGFGSQGAPVDSPDGGEQFPPIDPAALADGASPAAPAVPTVPLSAHDDAMSRLQSRSNAEYAQDACWNGLIPKPPPRCPRMN
jgi:pilus assembly protein CpaF